MTTRRTQFSLLELMISVALFAAILAVVYYTLYKSSTVYKEDSNLLMFEYRINQIMNQVTLLLRESWIRNKQTMVPANDDDPSTTFFRDDAGISMVNDAPDPDPLATANNMLLVFARPDPTTPVDNDTSDMNYSPTPDFLRLARGDLNGDRSTATTETISEVTNSKDYNRDGDRTDVFEVRELVRSNGTPVFSLSRRIFILRATTAGSPAPCVMVRDEINGRAISLRLNFLFYDPNIDATLPGSLETLPGNAVVVLMNRQTD